MSEVNGFQASAQFTKYTPGRLLRLEVREWFGNHALAFLDYPVPRTSVQKIPKEGTPMVARWGRISTGRRNFYGYVNHHEIIEQESDFAIMRIWCIGTSLPMNQPRTKKWGTVTQTSIAQAVAKRYNMRCVISKKIKVSNWTQTAESDFAMLNRLAAATGQRFWVDGTTLYFVDPLALLNRTANSVPTFRLNGRPSDSLLGVKIVSGSLVPRDFENAITEVLGTGPNGAKIRSTSAQELKNRGLPVPKQTRTTIVGPSTPAEVKRIATAAGTSQEWSLAEVDVLGDLRNRVGSVVNLTGKSLHPEHSGRWLAKEVVSVVAKDSRGRVTSFENQMLLTRNSVNKLVVSKGGSKNAAKDLKSVIKNKQWTAPRLETEVIQ